jgi:hypothetical protein
MATGGLNLTLVIVMMINIILGISQYTMNQITSKQSQTFNTCGVIFKDFSINNDIKQGVDHTSFTQLIGANDSSTITGTSGIFVVVDWIGKAINFIKGLINTFSEFVAGPYCMLKGIPDLDIVIINYIAALWYGFTLMLVFGFILGR